MLKSSIAIYVKKHTCSHWSRSCIGLRWGTGLQGRASTWPCKGLVSVWSFLRGRTRPETRLIHTQSWCGRAGCFWSWMWVARRPRSVRLFLRREWIECGNRVQICLREQIGIYSLLELDMGGSDLTYTAPWKVRSVLLLTWPGLWPRWPFLTQPTLTRAF